MNMLKKWLSTFKDREIERKRKDIRESFQLKENGETLCISHSGDIIHAYTPETTVREILRELNEKRDTAVKFAKI